MHFHDHLHNASQVNMAGQEVTFMRRNGERVTLQGTSGTRIHGWHLASCIEEVISQQEAADKKGQPAWFYHLCIMTVAVLHAMAPWVLTLAIETEQKQQLVHACQEVRCFECKSPYGNFHALEACWLTTVGFLSSIQSLESVAYSVIQSCASLYEGAMSMALRV